MMRRWLKYMILAYTSTVVCASCERRPLTDQSYNVWIDLEIEDEITNYELESLPETMVVSFYDPESGQRVNSNNYYIGSEGGYVNIPPGNYDIVVYNAARETTVLDSEYGAHDELMAYTDEVSDFEMSQMSDFLKARAALHATKAEEDGRLPEELDYPIVQTPDHLFVGRFENHTVPVQTDESQVHVIPMRAETVVKTYTVDVRVLQGAEYISSVDALLSGMVYSNYISHNDLSDKPVTIKFSLAVSDDKTFLTGSFETFGKMPSTISRLYLDLLVTDISGEQHIYSKDVTEQFNEGNTSQEIIVNESISVDEPEDGGGGGFSPDVDDWEEENDDLII